MPPTWSRAAVYQEISVFAGPVLRENIKAQDEDLLSPSLLSAAAPEAARGVVTGEGGTSVDAREKPKVKSHIINRDWLRAS